MAPVGMRDALDRLTERPDTLKNVPSLIGTVREGRAAARVHAQEQPGGAARLLRAHRAARMWGLLSEGITQRDFIVLMPAARLGAHGASVPDRLPALPALRVIDLIVSNILLAMG